MTGRTLSAVAVLVLMTSGCNGAGLLGMEGRQDTAAPAAGEIMVDGIRAVLTVSPSTVERTHAFEVRLTLVNTRSTSATWTSGMGCIAFLNVLRNGQRVPLRGTDYGCLAVVTTRTLAPGETLVTTWELVAQTTDASQLDPGAYILEADPVLADQRTLQHPLTIL